MKMFKNTLCLSTIALMGLALAVPVSAGQDAHKDHQHGTASNQNHEGVMGKGVVHSIDLENRKINLSHDPIPELKWPKMTMDLDVAENVDLSTLKPEQNINFYIVLGDDKVYRITKIMTMEEEHKCEPDMDCPMHKDMKHHSDDHGDDHHGDHSHH